jgi:hypothetical protein
LHNWVKAERQGKLSDADFEHPALHRDRPHAPVAFDEGHHHSGIRYVSPAERQERP